MNFDVLRLKDKNLIVNPKNASWVVADSEAQKLILKGKIDGLPKLLKKRVLESGITKDEGMPRKKNHPLLGIFCTTTACNLRCKYCYASAGEKNDFMSIEVAKKCVDFLLQSKSNHVTFVLHGGEPSLLGKKWIREFLTYVAKKKNTHKNKLIKVKMQTNATLMDDDLAKMLAHFGVKVGISIDGIPQVNDLTRPLADGKGATDLVLKGLKNLQNNGLCPGAIIVVSKANFKKIKESMQFLKSKGIHSFKLISLSQLGRSAKNKKYQITSKQYFTAIKDAIDFCLKSDSKLQLYPVYYLIYNLLNKDRPYMCLRSPCGAVNSVLAFDTKGNIYPCDDLVGFKQYILGNVFDTSLEKVLKNRTSKMFQERTVDKIDDCMECTWRNFCGGGCSGRVLLTYGKLNHCSDICDYYRTIFPYLIELIYKDKEKVAEKMMSCALE